VLTAVHVEIATSRPVDDELAQVGAASFADTEQPLFATGRVLPRYQAKPRGELPATFELLAVADGCDQGRCDEGPDARNRE
jgi:hypothetical protein